MTPIKRYVVGEDTAGVPFADEHPEGEWVRYEDAEEYRRAGIRNSRPFTQRLLDLQSGALKRIRAILDEFDASEEPRSTRHVIDAIRAEIRGLDP